MKVLMKARMLIYRLFYRLMKPAIKVSEARLSGDGSFLDIRYWLSRPDKTDPKGSIYITPEGSDERIYVMRIAKFGAIRTRHDKRRHTGNLLLYNRNGLVKPGSRVTLHLDGLTARGIGVE